jgi:peroxiredoxin
MYTVRIGPGGRSLRLLGLFLVIAFLVPLTPGNNRWTNTPSVRAQEAEGGYEAEIEKGRDLLRRRRYEDALKSFKRANDLRNKLSPEAFLLMAQAYQGLDAYKNVVTSCDKVIELAGNDTQLQVQAYNLKGIALQSQAEMKDLKKHQEAEAVFRQALALNTDLHVLHYNLGVTLLRQLRDPEGIAELKKYVELQSDGSKAEQALKLIENPRRAREAYAPDFSFTTADGEYISLEDLRGKVVLLDFWGTWCPPCVASVPSLRDLFKKYSKDAPFLIIGVSSDGDEDKWRAFTAENKMIWPQYLDRDRNVQRAFAVRAFPTYVLIDHEGIVRFRVTGLSFEREAALSDAIKKQIKIVAKNAPME